MPNALKLIETYLSSVERTQEDQATLSGAVEEWEKKTSDVEWGAWMKIGAALMIGRKETMAALGVDDITGNAYKVAFSFWCKKANLVIDKEIRSNLLYLQEHLDICNELRASMTQTQTQRLRATSPITMAQRVSEHLKVVNEGMAAAGVAEAEDVGNPEAKVAEAEGEAKSEAKVVEGKGEAAEAKVAKAGGVGKVVEIEDADDPEFKIEKTTKGTRVFIPDGDLEATIEYLLRTILIGFGDDAGSLLRFALNDLLDDCDVQLPYPIVHAPGVQASGEVLVSH